MFIINPPLGTIIWTDVLDIMVYSELWEHFYLWHNFDDNSTWKSIPFKKIKDYYAIHLTPKNSGECTVYAIDRNSNDIHWLGNFGENIIYNSKLKPFLTFNVDDWWYYPQISYLEISNINTEKIGNTGIPNFLQGTGCCTWESLKPFYNFDQVDNFITNFNSVVDWIILDDGWQNVNPLNNRLVTFSFKDYKILKFIDSCKQRHIQVGLWLHSTGYWGGIDMKGFPSESIELAKPVQQVHNLSFPNRLNVIKLFYTKYFQYYKDLGIQFIKLDGQNIFSLLKDKQLGNEILKVMHSCASSIFGDNVIHCMCHSEFNLGLIRNNYKNQIIRSSQDYVPQIPSLKFSHYFNNILNSSYFRKLGFTCDFDMVDGDDYDQILLRLISHSPLYFSSPFTIDLPPRVPLFKLESFSDMHLSISAIKSNDFDPNIQILATPDDINIWLNSNICSALDLILFLASDNKWH
eukprot:NODE_239_length_11955_cov_0.931174.p2 type:complete len:462 gc:universal NODE_239_length_11955_cov_0.931174:3984-5369(+)